MFIGRDTIYEIDCLEGMKSIPDASIDMVFCDLPYGVTKGSWDVVIPADKLWVQYERIIKSNGAILLFGQDKFTARMMLSNEKLHRYNIIWKKVLTTGFLNANRMPLRVHEDIMVFYKKLPVYNPERVKGDPNHNHKRLKKGDKATDQFSSDLGYVGRVYGKYKLFDNLSDLYYPTSVWEFSRPHPSVALSSTEKPIELCRYVIRTYSNKGDTVLDNCCGSGSIPIAAKMEGRHYIGMDNGKCDRKKSKYYGLSWAEVTRRRLAEAS